MMDASERHELKAKYMPTPQQIAAECAAIQETWSEVERRRRSAPERPVDLGNVVRIVEISEE